MLLLLPCVQLQAPLVVPLRGAKLLQQPNTSASPWFSCGQASTACTSSNPGAHRHWQGQAKSLHAPAAS